MLLVHARDLFFRSLIILVLIIVALVIGVPRATAVEVPPANNPTYLQTNGPNAGINNGDWYTASAAQGGAGGYHYFQINIPCGWPNNLPIHFDLWSPELNQNAQVFGTYDETDNQGLPTHTAPTTFELYGPGTQFTAPSTPGPNAPGSLISRTYNPVDAGPNDVWDRLYTLNAPATCGNYLLRSQTRDDDQNGWRLRVGYIPGGAGSTPPPNYDNPDGTHPITIGILQASYQNDVPNTNTCLTLYQFVAPGQATVVFHNFDFDDPALGAQRVRYYAPNDPTYDPNGQTGGIPGTPSGSATANNPNPNQGWNNGNTPNRGTGDPVNNPQPGWWRIVSCVSTHNQFIQEGQSFIPTYYAQPPTMSVGKDDGRTIVGPNDVLTYTLTFANVSNADSSPMPATGVVLTDTMPPNTTYVSCGINLPYHGTCAQNGNTVVYHITENVAAGASGTARVTVRTNPNIPAGSITNTVELSHTDPYGNPYPHVTATDTDTVQVAAPVMAVLKDDGRTIVGANDVLTYTISYTNTGTFPASPAANVVFTDTIPPNTTYVSCSNPAGTCTPNGNQVVFHVTGQIAAGASGSASVTVRTNPNIPAGSITNSVTLSYTDTNNNPRPPVTSTDTDTVVLQAPVMTVAKDDGRTVVHGSDVLTYTLTFANVAGAGGSPAANVILTDTLPPNTTYVSCSIDPGIFAPNRPRYSGRCDQNGSTVVFRINEQVATGATGRAYVTIRVNANAPAGNLVNTVRLTYTDPQGNPQTPVTATDTDTVPQAVPSAPLMTVAKDDGRVLVSALDVLTYTLTFANVATTNPSPAANVVFTDTLPPNTTYVSCAIDNGIYAPNRPRYTGSCGLSGGRVIFRLNEQVAPGATGRAYVTIQVNANVPVGDLTNVVTLAYTDPQGNPQTPVNASDTDVVQQAVLPPTAPPGSPSTPAEVPEADTLMLVGTGGAGFFTYLAYQWRQRRRKK